LDSWQEEEMRSLNEKLNHELNSLLEFQNRQKTSLESSCQRELDNLNSAWANKKAALQKKVD
jgi:phosphopantetheine adenylyltransferase